MSESPIKVGECVRVCSGVSDADVPELPLVGWIGRVEKIDVDEEFCELRWTEETLERAHPIYKEMADHLGLVHDIYRLHFEDFERVSEAEPVVFSEPEVSVVESLYNRYLRFRFHSHFGAPDTMLTEVYRNELALRFESSPEFDELLNREFFFEDFLEMAEARRKLASEITPAIQQQILVHDAARRVKLDHHASVVEELKAFWLFVEREFDHAQARLCYEALNTSLLAMMRTAFHSPKPKRSLARKGKKRKKKKRSTR